MVKSLWKKSENPQSTQNEDIQGSYTGHSLSPLVIRQQLNPMGTQEFEAFQFVLNKLRPTYPTLNQNELIHTALDLNYFSLGPNQELIVNKKLPKQ